MPEMTAEVTVRKPVEESVTFNKEIKTTGSGSTFINLDNDNYNISLFPAKVKADPEKKSRIVYNATIHLKQAGIRLHMEIKELTSGERSGELLAGQKSKMNGERAVVTEWDRDRKISYEKASISNSVYSEIMAIITKGVK